MQTLHFNQKSINGVQCVYVQIVDILRIEPFAIFDFDPSLNSRQITDSNFGSNQMNFQA